MTKKLSSPVLAGFLIGIGCNVYQSCENKYVGALLFALGLYFICFLGSSLYTGKIGFYDDKDWNLSSLAFIWLGNFLGAFLCAMITFYSFKRPTLTGYWDINQLHLFLKAFMTGVLMYLAVYHYRTATQHKELGIFLCIPCFLLCGFRHCVADMFYFWFSDSWGNIIPLLVATAGNTAGAICVAQVIEWHKS